MAEGDLDLDASFVKAEVFARLFGRSRAPLRLGRFELVRRLGRGGTGVVYEARDSELGGHVALKSLVSFDAEAIYRMKREFRALSNLVHPNLVVLHELFGHDGDWFLTMELVDGVPFDHWVRREPADIFDESRMLNALGQLAEAVATLHRSHKLHRDLKPSNVLITARGRLVVLDFGLMSEQGYAQDDAALDALGGTPSYVAPEQAAGEPASPASDWYAVGVMMFEAITGRLPFEGSSEQVLSTKQQEDAPDVRAFHSAISPALAELCAALLNRDPIERAGLHDVLSIVKPGAAASRRRPASERPVPFVGRTRELSVLQQALSRARSGTTSSVLVHGQSGIGKTALLEHFTRSIAGQAVVLGGSCYAQELVPYKVFDGVVDALVRHLRTETPAQIRALRPRHVRSLVQLFPALTQVPDLVDRRVIGTSRASEGTMPQDIRERRDSAFSALKELLSRLAQSTPVVVVVDDLQWGDADSVQMFRHIVGPPNPPALLFVGTYRTDEAENSEFLRLLFDADVWSLDWQPIRVELLPLHESEATELVHLLVAEDRLQASPQLPLTIAAEALGVPFLITEVAQHLDLLDVERNTPAAALVGTQPQAAALVGTQPQAAVATIDTMLLRRITGLAPDARELLQLLGVAGGPMPHDLALQIVPLADHDTTLSLLRSLRLVRKLGRGNNKTLDVYHDCIRQAAIRSMDRAALVAMHRRIAEALDGTGDPDPERLLVHCLAMGESVRAGKLAEQAAHIAARSLAFNHAAELFAKAIALLPPDEAVPCKLHEHMAEALAHVGQRTRSAQAYLEAAERSTGADQARLRRLAAQQYLRSGQTQSGVQLARELTRRAGLYWPSSKLSAIAYLLWNRLLLSLRGFGHRIVERTSVPPERLERVDLLGAIFREIGAINVLAGMALHARFMREALAVGEPHNLMLGLTWETINSALLGGRRHQNHVTRMLSYTSAIATQVATPYALATEKMSRVGQLYFAGHFSDAASLAAQAEKEFQTRCPGTSWEQHLLLAFRLGSLEWCGDLAQIARDITTHARDAMERNDRFFAGFLTLSLTAAQLMADDPSAVLAALDRGRATLEDPFGVPHLWAMHRTIDAYNYTGRGVEALAYHRERWHAFTRSYLFLTKPYFMLGHWYRVKSALGAAAQRDKDSKNNKNAEALELAERSVAALASCDRGDARTLALLGRAGIACQRSDRDAAAALLRQSIESAETNQCGLLAVYARRNLGLVLGQKAGEQLIAEADDALRRQLVTNPQRWVAAFAPGFTNPLRRGRTR